MAPAAGGMQCICDGQGMAASCTLPPDAAGSWAPILMLAAIVYLLWLREEDSDEDGKPPVTLQFCPLQQYCTEWHVLLQP